MYACIIVYICVCMCVCVCVCVCVCMCVFGCDELYKYTETKSL